MRTRFLIALLVMSAALALTAGCNTHFVEPDAMPLAPDKRIDGEALFGYERGPIAAVEEVTERREKYDIVRVQFPACFQDDPENTTVTAWYYRQHTSAPTAGLIQIPILGGDYGPSIMFAEKFADNGFHVLRFERKNAIFEVDGGLEHTRKVMTRSVIDIRRGLDWWLTKTEVDKKRIGVCGISMGGFQGSMLMAVDSRVSAGTFLINGGDLAKLIMVSAEGEVVDFRNAVMKNNGWDEATMFKHAQEVLDPIDPLRYAANLDPQRVLFISALLDQVVPFDLSTKFYEAANKPTRIVLPVGHYSTILYVIYAQESCILHFRDVFGIDTPLYPTR